MQYARILLLGLLAVFAAGLLGGSAAAQPAVIATIPVGNGPWGVDANPVTNRIYVANSSYSSNSVSVIDGATNAVIATVPVGVSPHDVGVNPATNLVYVANRGSDNVSVIDGATNAVIATVPVGDAPYEVGVNPATNRVYVPNSHSDTVSVIDGAANTVVATIPVGDLPRRVAVNPGTDRVYVTNDYSDTVSVIDGATNTVVATVPVGDPRGIAVNPDTGRIYVSDLEWGYVYIIDGATNQVIDTVAASFVAFGVAVNPTTNRIYVVSEYNDNVSVIDGQTNTVVAYISVGDRPYGVGVNPTTNRIYVTNHYDHTVSVVEDDADGDGIRDPADNCPAVANPGQENNVHAGTCQGDHCEDPDNDLVFDIVDNCPDVYNPDQADSDGDGIGDACEVIVVPIDIKPGSDPNSINLACHGVIPVAILTTLDFDAATVDPDTVTFAGAAPNKSHLEDVDGDGDIDMILHFKCQEVSIEPGATEAWLEGSTYGGADIEGRDSVRLVPPDSPADSDGDAFTDAEEICLGTDLLDNCSADAIADNEPVDALPADTNDDRSVNMLDVFPMFPFWLGVSARHDLNADGFVNVQDVFKMFPRWLDTCT